jgi:hypothetical protein
MLDQQKGISSSKDKPAPDPSKKTARARSSFPTSFHLRRENFWRPQDWRWRRAEFLLAEQESPSPRLDDEFVEAALHFLQEDLSGQDLPASKRLLPAGTRAAMQSAQQIHDRNDIGTWMLQAWLLTGESLEFISGETSTPIEEIVWFARLFFDVQERLHSRSFITHRVIGPKIHYGLSEKDVDVIWRFWAYNGGRYILQSLLDDFIETGRDDYGYLFDGTFRNAVLPMERLLLHQAIRVQLLSIEDITKMLFRVLKEPETLAGGRTFGDLIQSLVMPDIDCSSAETGGEPAIPVEALQEVMATEIDVARVA